MKNKQPFYKEFPLLLQEWDHEANVGMDPADYSFGSNKSVAWVCSFCGNHWKMTINKRTHGRGCPHCKKSGSSFSEQAVYFYLRRVFPDAEHRKQLFECEFDVYIPCISTVVEYDGIYYHQRERAYTMDEKKDGLCRDNGIRLIRLRDPRLMKTPYAICIDCTDTQGAKLRNAIQQLLSILVPGHEVSVDPDRDYLKIAACYRQQLKSHSLATCYPELCAYWVNEKNHPFSPDTVSVGQHGKFWWHCPLCEQEYQMDISHKVHGEGCPICSGKKIVAGVNDLASTYPQIAAQWNDRLNAALTAQSVTAGSNKRVWWHCPVCGFDWQAAPATRIKGVGCPCCAGKSVKPGFNDLRTKYPQVALEWDDERNANLKPEQFTPGSDRRVWWKCSVCGYQWKASISSRTAGCGCEMCARKRRGANKQITAARLHPLSVLRPEIAKQWHPTKNGDLKPEDVSVSSNRKVVWLCENGHDWSQSVNTRTGQNTGCPYCRNRKVWPGFNDLATIAPGIAEDWDSAKNEKTADEVLAGSHAAAWWKCASCGASWRACVRNRVRGTSRCPHCG